MFSSIIDPVALTFIVVAFILLLMECVYGLRAYYKAATFSEPLPASENDYHPKASVLVYCQSDEETLEATLADIALQDYPDFEVIVVCDASSEYAEYLQEKYAPVYPNVYITFVQPGSHNLSRRKLAITIGAKAAKGEIIVMTVANVVIPSEKWLSYMMAPFCGEKGRYKDVALGLSSINFSNLHGPSKWYRQFDATLTNALWVGYAASGHPYRGDGYNLAFRREVFFKHKGFARTINLHYGDDDLFIHEIATPSNTSVVVCEDAILETQWGESGNRVWKILKERYSFTSRWLPHAPFIRSSVQMLLQWMMPATCVLAGWLAWPNVIPAIIALVLLLVFWGAEIACYRLLAARFGVVRLWWGVVPFWLWRPLADMLFRYDHRHLRKKNFTWQR